jgi:hypothetical protein
MVFVTDKTVVLADLIIDGESKGPHAFVMDFRIQDTLVDGITVADMGQKTVSVDRIILATPLYLRFIC